MVTPAFKILYEDDWLLAINKPAGWLVQPVGRQRETTVSHWLAQSGKIQPSNSWPDPERAGLVHRLDRDTSGVLLLAKTPAILTQLSQAFADRRVRKNYLTLVTGQPSWDDYHIQAPVSRSEGTRRQATFLQLPDQAAKAAETVFRVLKKFHLGASLLAAQPKTGRTNQIRVHLQLLGYPILGDPWYQTKTSRKLSRSLAVPRLMLHAEQLVFNHPLTQIEVSITAPLPADFDTVVRQLEKS